MPATPATEVQPEDHRNVLERKVLQRIHLLELPVSVAKTQRKGLCTMIRNRQGSSGRVSFVHRFVRDTEITGGMTLKLWVSTSNGEDLDLFVLLRKFDADGLETFSE